MLKSKTRKLFIINFIILITLQGCNIKNIPSVPAVVAAVRNELQPDAKISKKNYPLFHSNNLIDIPFPNSAEIYDLSIEPNNQKYILQFKSSLTQFELSAFFRSEMEYLGWNEQCIMNGHESSLLFTKPSKVCMISLRDSDEGHYKAQATIFISNNSKIGKV